MSSDPVARTRNATSNVNASLLLLRIAHCMPEATREFGRRTYAGRQPVGLQTAPEQAGGQL